MVRIRGDIFRNYNFSNYTILEIKQCLWVEVLISKSDANCKSYWLKVSFKKQIIKVLKKRWTSDLLDFQLFEININDLRSNFDPTYFSDCELYLEKLVKIKDELKKKEFKRYKKHKKIYADVKTLRF